MEEKKSIYVVLRTWFEETIDNPDADKTGTNAVACFDSSFKVEKVFLN